ncbi:MAG: LuxR C-terminal-related transcriptional regulator [Anaerolineales bacterium]|nr:LuxR C-terminal-related transcriptional regulator [Anaerolineales bacterium]
MKTIILATKLHQPIPPTRGIHRQRLVDRLNQGLQASRPLTLVSAPAGFGKSTCISEWIDQLDLPAAWLSLDTADDDPARFLAYFVAALQKLDNTLGCELNSILETGQDLPPESIGTILLDDILRLDRRYLLVLDDLQNIQEQSILEILEMLITNLPPQLHLVFITREDPLIPLARLRANNQMTEIRAEDLRFTSSESQAFFMQTMGLTLADDDLRILENRIEGWVAGLQLVGLSISGRENPSVFIANLSGTQRHILSYLTEEVLNHQSTELQNFLVETSILDKVCGELCDAITGRTDSGSLLDRMFSANLFLIPLDGEQHWYRYHHLFKDLLRSQQSRISKERIFQLRREASRWFDRVGMAAEAIEQALAGEDFGQAVNLLEQHAMSFAMQGYVKTVEGWMQTIPSALLSQSPRAYLAFASVYLMRGNYAEVAKNLNRAEAAIFQAHPEGEWAVSETADLQSEWYAIQANLLNVQGRPTESLAAAAKSLELARPEQYHTLAIAYLGMGGAYRLTGDYPRLVDAYQKAIQNSRAAGNLLAEMLSSTALALMAIQYGQLHFAHQIGLEAVDRYERSHKLPPPVSGSVYGVLGLVEYEWNQLGIARKYFAQAFQLNSFGGHNAGIVFAKVLLARLAQAEGNLVEATRLVNEAVNLLHLGVPAWLRPEVVAQQVRIYLAQNNPVSAEAILKQFPGSFLEPGKYPSELIFIAHLRIVLHRVHSGSSLEEHQVLLQLADRRVAEAIHHRRLGIALELILVVIKIYATAGDKETALEGLGQALQMAEAEGYVRTFVDAGPEIAGLLKIAQRRNLYPETVRQLLAAFPTAKSSPAAFVEQPGLVEPLSERELGVLRLMSEGLTNPEIAARLFISVSTVKTHLIHIFGKLNVRNRAEAVLKAKNLGIL